MKTYNSENKIRCIVTLDKSLAEKAKASGNRSGLINKLLAKYFKALEVLR
jgi:hypothetical protein